MPSVLNEYRVALRRFSPPARRFLLATLLAWMGHGISQVLFNLYLVESGYREGFVGRIISLNGAGLALVALPAGWLADRWGRRRSLVLGAVIEGVAMIVRATATDPAAISIAAFATGAGQSMFVIAAAPFLTEHSTPRERTHLFSAFFACELLAGVIGSLIGGWLPAVLHRTSAFGGLSLLLAYRVSLVVGAGTALIAVLPMLTLRGVRDEAIRPDRAAAGGRGAGLLVPIAVNAFLIGAGAGLVIPFMNLYFARRFQCSSAQIGMFFSVAQVTTAAAAMLGPVVARRFGALRTAIGSELLSLPFLVTLGAERRLATAVGAFWIRATLMQAAAPLLSAFIMEALPPALRARSTSVSNMVWNLGWAVSATLSGAIIQRFGYAVPFYVTAVLYASAGLYFYRSFRGRERPVSAESMAAAAANPGAAPPAD